MAHEPVPPSSTKRDDVPGSAGLGKQVGGEAPQSARQTDGESLTDTVLLLARVAGIGWTVAIAIIAGTVAGWWLDRRFDTGPWLTLAGITLGAAAGFTAMIRLLRSVAGAKRKNKESI
ncbi:MAG: AtpZ/AtpI family protein [Dehalococcoidia bacterium]|nr:AtpZ/AtpI family protein [Dehalococcoidia bacterium]MSQ34195.1 AtpZ/AtpI family protein [Dehalococcoidia bacterium]